MHLAARETAIHNSEKGRKPRRAMLAEKIETEPINGRTLAKPATEAEERAWLHTLYRQTRDNYRSGGAIRCLSREEEFLVFGIYSAVSAELKRLGEELKAGGNGDTKDLEKAISEKSAMQRLVSDVIIASIQKIVRYKVHVAMRSGVTHLSFEDLIQRVNESIAENAIPKFDRHRGRRFSTYAGWWIKQSIGRAIGDLEYSIRLPAHAYEKMRREMASPLISTVSIDEAAEGDGRSYRRLRVLKWLADRDTPNPEEEKLMKENHALAKQLLSVLDKRELDIIKNRFELYGTEWKTLEEVGEMHNLTKERIRQLEKQSLEKMKAEMKKIIKPAETGLDGEWRP